jgi:dTDP-glucose 4,6-dehydratase
VSGTTLITGGAGFIGTNLLRQFAAETDERLLVLDALTYAGDLTGIGPLVEEGRISLVEGNIGDDRLLKDLFVQNDIRRVMHLAAESHVDRSITGPGPFLATNVNGTFALLEAAREAWDGDQDVRFVHVSTDEVFGDLAPGAPPATAATPYEPSSPYAASKAASDHLARAWHRTYGVPVIVTNCTNNYGPWQFPEKLLPLMILNAVAGEPLPVYGDGEQIRDWIHVSDHCNALRHVIRCGEVGGTYLIGANAQRTNIDLVHQVCDTVDRLLERKPNTARGLIAHVTDRPGHDRRYALDTTTMDALGWRPTMTVEAGLEHTIEWYLRNNPWCERIRSGAYREWYRRQYLSN